MLKYILEGFNSVPTSRLSNAIVQIGSVSLYTEFEGTDFGEEHCTDGPSPIVEFTDKKQSRC